MSSIATTWFTKPISAPITSGVCERLVWDDIPPSPTGLRRGLRGSIASNLDLTFDLSNSYSRSERRLAADCWRVTLGDIYSRAWLDPQRQLARVPKPPCLDPKRRYICTDTRIIRGFIHYTAAGEHWSPGIVPFIPQQRGNTWQLGKTEIQLKECDDGTAVAHLKGSDSLLWKEDLTKGDIEGFIAGYSGWYRAEVILENGSSVPHPIKSRRDVKRAGWIIALGLQNPMVNYITSCPLDGQFMDKPVKRLLDILENCLRPAFPDDPAVRSAALDVRYLYTHKTNSGAMPADSHEHGSLALTEQQATFAMGLFNGPPNKVLTLDELDMLSPIIKQVCYAAHRGAYEVVSTLKNVFGQSFRWPKLLDDPQRLIYVESCGSCQ
jgi:hypothetical protein